jgi:hypothetical protein
MKGISFVTKGEKPTTAVRKPSLKIHYHMKMSTMAFLLIMMQIIYLKRIKVTLMR